MSTEKPRRLGRGLGALFANAGLGATGNPTGIPTASSNALRSIPLSEIRPNPLQPRQEFDEADLRDLQASIRANGLLQPVCVRAVERGYQLIAGERRFRAIQLLGWQEIPAIVKEEGDIGDKALLTLALVENLQRTDLNPMEEADGYQNLISRFSLTQSQIAEAVGKDRSTVANTLRLLALPSLVRKMVREGALTIGHARALLALGDDQRMIELSQIIIAEGLSVREVERRVRDLSTLRAATAGNGKRSEPQSRAEVSQIEETLRRRFQTDVKLHLTTKDRGEVRISFYSTEDLERLLDLMFGATRETP